MWLASRRRLPRGGFKFAECCPYRLFCGPCQQTTYGLTPSIPRLSSPVCDGGYRRGPAPSRRVRPIHRIVLNVDVSVDALAGHAGEREHVGLDERPMEGSQRRACMWTRSGRGWLRCLPGRARCRSRRPTASWSSCFRGRQSGSLTDGSRDPIRPPPHPPSAERDGAPAPVVTLRQSQVTHPISPSA